MSDAEVDYSRVWQDTIRHLDGQGVAQRQRAFLGISQLVGVLQNLAIIVTPNSMTKGVIEDQIGGAVRQALSDQLGVEIAQLSVSVDEKLGEDFPPPLTDDAGSDPLTSGNGQTNGTSVAPPGPAVPLAPDACRLAYRHPASERPRATPGARQEPAEPEVHLRHLRRRLEQPVRARGRARRRRGAGAVVQPAVHLRRLRAGQDPPAARDRRVLAPAAARTCGCAT